MADTAKKEAKKQAESLSANGQPNSRLKKLLNLINESTQWSAEEKSIAEQTVKDTEKELADKNHEIEIEATLEKVRAKALVMNDPSDMPEVCRTISDQLENLKVKNIRNVQTAIINESKGTYFNYEYYAKYHKTFITEVDYSHPMSMGFINQMLKGPGEFFSHTLERKELKDWYEYQKTTNQFADQYLESAKSLTYYWYSLGPVALGISTYSPLSDEEMDLFKRFRNVFELAYRRFLDIEKAIAQAREAQIEAALERVRASALAMLKSNDVNDAVVVMFETLEKLEPGMLRCGVGIIREETRTADVWATSSTDHGTILKVTGDESVDVHPLLKGAFDAWKNQHDFSSELKGEDLIRYYRALEKTNFRLQEASSIIEKAEAQLNSQPLQQFYYVAPFEAGNLFAFRETPFPDEAKKIIRRFASVFNLTYKRFLDLQRAEERAREAMIEAALERVRAQAMAMHTTDELKNVGEVIFAELNSLSFSDIRNTEIIINNDEKETVLSHYCDYGVPGTIEVDYKKNPILHKWAEDMRKASDAFVSVVISEKEMAAWRKFREEMGYQPDPKLNAATSVYYYSYSTGLGALSISSFSPLNDEQKKTLERFRNVFTLAYRRYVDVSQAEAQAREAQIELALERVRASAMSMKQAAEMTEVCQIIAEQLQQLGIEGIRNVQTAIINEEKGTYTKYEYFTQYKTTSVMEIEIKLSPIIEEFVSKILSSKDSFFTRTVEGPDLEILHSYRKSTHQNPDPILEKVNAVYYYFYSIGPGALGICTFSPLDDKEINLFKRFKKVFELAYRRFLDIQKAEAQARETQIELALERVRARTMAMQKSEELSETARVLFQQFNDLGANPIQITIGIYNEEENVIEFRSTDPFGTGASVDYAMKGSLEEPTLLKKIYGDWKEGKKSTVIALEGKELSEWVKYRINISGVPDDRDYSDKRRVVYVGFFSKGMLSVSSIDDPTRESVQLLERFAGVFDLTYTRFLDLKQAEAQAREATIEASLEKVRSRSLAMHTSDEIKDVVVTVMKKMNELNIELNGGVSLVTFIEGSQDLLHWYVNPGHVDEPQTMLLPYFDNLVFNDFVEARKAAQEILPVVYSFEEKNNYFEYAFEHSDFKIAPEELKKWIFEQPYFGYSVAIQKHSAIFFNDYTGKLFTKETNDILIRFSKVFEQAYVRFLDLQKAEAQAREAQIEAALERVRSRTMGMQKSEELKEVIQVVYEQFVHLNINIEHTGFVIDYKTRDDYAIWIADPLGVPSQVTIPYFDSVYYNRFNEAKEKGEDFFAINLTFEEKNKFYQKLFEYVPGLPEESKQFYFSCPGLAASTVLLENIGLYIENFSGIPYSGEENATLMRFGKVFQQTYTRFLDLQKAEEQAREAQIEASLERVRGRAMAMHSSSDLSAAAAMIFTELRKLGIKPIRSGVVLVSKESHQAQSYSAIPGADGEELALTGGFSLSGNTVLEQQYQYWLRKENYFTSLKGEDLKSYYKAISSGGMNIINRDNVAADQEEFGHWLMFSEGFLFAWSDKKYSGEEIKILDRFKNIVELTFRRYLDLKKAEAQVRESQIEAGLERVRSRTLAMHSSEELAETAAVVFKQLIHLGIEPNRLYISIIKDEAGNTEFWITDEDGSKVSSEYTANLNGNSSFSKMFNGWKEHKKSITIDMQGKELEEYFLHLQKLNVPFKGGLSQTRRVQNIAYFSRGFIGIASPDSQREETTQLLERFASVFDLTYTRFSDLQLAEAQAKQAQMEAAMERVRGRALAMQQPEELMDVAETLRKEMGMLGVSEIETGTIFIFDEAAETVQFGFTARDFSKPEKAPVTDTITIDLNKTWAGKEFLKFFRSEENRMTLHMEGIARKEWIEDIYSQSSKANNYFGENIQDRTYHLLKFSNGAVAAVTDDFGLSDENWDLLSRASSVFSLAYSRFKDLTKARIDLQNLKEEKKRSDSLLLNILPEEIAAELKQFGKSYARKYDQVTILFADIKGFSSIAEKLSAQELVTQLDECFRAFDHIVDKHGLEKIKTVGDAYVCACGLPKPVPDNAVRAVRAAIDMMSFIKGFSITRTIQDLPAFEFRIGIHTGPVITGVVGLRKFTYDIWGDAVNMAARMEQHGEAGRINISESTHSLIKDKFTCISRGKIVAKNKGEVEMYFVEQAT